VTVSHKLTSDLTDPKLPALAALLAPGIPEPLLALGDELGARVTAAEAIQVTWWPGRGITVRYRAKLEGGQIPGEHQLVAVSGDIPEGALIVDGDGGARVGLWRVPFDPQLPGLASALDPGTTGALLDDLGLPAGKVRTKLRAYRPGKRAVVEVTRSSGSIFLKIVPPMDAGRLHHIHQFLLGHLPVPQSLGYSPDLGIIALHAMAGTTLRQRLLAGGPLPTPAALESLLAALPVPDRSWKAPSPIDRVPRLGELLSALLPKQASLVGELVAEIGVETLKADRPVHGDFYEAQVMTARDQVVGMLDFDTFGMGRAPDDPATMIGHLAVLSHTYSSARIRGFANDLLRRADSHHDPVDLRRRVASAVLSLATGPFRVQRPNWPQSTQDRLHQVKRWLESARRVEETGFVTNAGLSQTLAG
jgi:hypothetical protein